MDPTPDEIETSRCGAEVVRSQAEAAWAAIKQDPAAMAELAALSTQAPDERWPWDGPLPENWQ